MKILIIIGSFKMGGAERMSINTGEELIKKGYDVFYIVQRPIFEIPNTIPIDKIFILRELDRSNYFYKITSLFFGVFKVSKRVRPDVIISFTRFSSFLANFSFHSKIIARFDAYPYRMNKKQRFWADFIIKSPLIKKIVVPSTTMITKLNKIRPNGKKKYTLIPNSINAASIRDKAKQDIVHYDFEYISAMGRFSPQKNFELLLHAYAESDISNRFKLIIIGDGANRSKLKKIVKNLYLSDKVIFTGNLVNPFPIIKESQFFVNPSKFESFGNVILEALILGKPVIATNCNFGPSDMIENNVNGFLVKDNDLGDMVAKLNILGKDDDLIEQFGINASSCGDKFHINTIGNEWSDLIESI